MAFLLVNHQVGFCWVQQCFAHTQAIHSSPMSTCPVDPLSNAAMP